MALPELGRERSFVSESVFASIFISFVLWTFHPFIYHSKRFYTVLLWRRVLAFLVVSEAILNFDVVHIYVQVTTRDHIFLSRLHSS